MTYGPQYALAWIVAAVGIVAGALASAYLLPLHPAWLSQDVAATAGVVSTVCVGLAALLPQIQRTPAVRDARYLSALAGALPDDIARKHGLTVTREGETLNVSSPEIPPAA